MTKKEELIIGILGENLKSIKKLLKGQEKELKEICKNGIDKHTHKAYHIDIYTGLSYTVGYCTGLIKTTEEAVDLLGMTDKEIEKLIAENKKISAENKKYLDGIFNEIKNELKNHNDTKKKSKK